MKFGDKVKVSDRLWKQLMDSINEINNPQLENYFIYIIGNKDISIIASTNQLTLTIGSLSADVSDGTSWDNYIYWKDYKDVLCPVKFINFIDDHPINKTGKFHPVPLGYRDIIQDPTITFNNIPTTEIFPLVDESLKLIHSYGGKCLICKDFNPYMEADGFCWSCNSDPRNKYKIEEILVKMASV